MSTSKEEVKQKMMKSIDNLRGELGKLRTGRANPAMVEHVQVEAYETKMPLNQVATINITDPKIIVIQPWDKSIIDDVKKAIDADESGLNGVVDGDIVRITLPPLTEETRKEYVKIMKERLEETRISMRQIRQDAIQEYDRAKDAGEKNEDEVKAWRKQMDELIAELNKMVEDIGEKKESEIMTV